MLQNLTYLFFEKYFSSPEASSQGFKCQGLLSPPDYTQNTKTDIVAAVIAPNIVVATGRTATDRIVVPRAAPQYGI